MIKPESNKKEGTKKFHHEFHSCFFKIECAYGVVKILCFGISQLITQSIFFILFLLTIQALNIDHLRSQTHSIHAELLTCEWKSICWPFNSITNRPWVLHRNEGGFVVCGSFLQFLALSHSNELFFWFGFIFMRIFSRMLMRSVLCLIVELHNCMFKLKHSMIS